jgi:hypothetical protein
MLSHCTVQSEKITAILIITVVIGSNGRSLSHSFLFGEEGCMEEPCLSPNQIYQSDVLVKRNVKFMHNPVPQLYFRKTVLISYFTQHKLMPRAGIA